MSIQSLAFLLIRLIGLYFLLIFLDRLPSSGNLFASDYPIEIFIGVLNLFIPFGFSLILFFGAFRISNMLIEGYDSYEEKSITLNYQNTTTIVVAAIGLFIFISEGFYLIGRIQSYFYYKEMNAFMNPEQIENLLFQVIISGVKVLVSFLLIVGSRKLTQAWIKFQNWT